MKTKPKTIRFTQDDLNRLEILRDPQDGNQTETIRKSIKWACTFNMLRSRKIRDIKSDMELYDIPPNEIINLRAILSAHRIKIMKEVIRDTKKAKNKDVKKIIKAKYNNLSVPV